MFHHRYTCKEGCHPSALLAGSAHCVANSYQPEWECTVCGGASLKRSLLLLYAVYSLFPDIYCLISQSIVTSFLIPCSLNFFSWNLAPINHLSQSRKHPVKLIYTTLHQFVQIEDVTMPVVVGHFFQVDLSSIEIFCREDHHTSRTAFCLVFTCPTHCSPPSVGYHDSYTIAGRYSQANFFVTIAAIYNAVKEWQ